mmetsp:Transcript_8590/g.14096  ORF Transcript_8590/g.14096 Transcript_8590/m.14096 type:complete len:212 (+) Transcript_8590:3093-3728(+)
MQPIVTLNGFSALGRNLTCTWHSPLAGMVPDIGERDTTGFLSLGSKADISKAKAKGMCSWFTRRATWCAVEPANTRLNCTCERSSDTSGSATFPTKTNGTSTLCSGILNLQNDSTSCGLSGTYSKTIWVVLPGAMEPRRFKQRKGPAESSSPSRSHAKSYPTLVGFNTDILLVLRTLIPRDSNSMTRVARFRGASSPRGPRASTLLRPLVR